MSLRLTSAAIIRKSIAPPANTSATLGSRSRSAIAYCNCPAARPRLMFNAAEISATTFACPSMAQQVRSSSSSGARRAYNSPIHANRRPPAAFSARADDPKPSITAASSTVARAASCGDAFASNIISMLAGATDKLWKSSAGPRGWWRLELGGSVLIEQPHRGFATHGARSRDVDGVCATDGGGHRVGLGRARDHQPHLP